MAARPSGGTKSTGGGGETASSTANGEVAQRAKVTHPPKPKQAHPEIQSIIDAVEMLQTRKLKPDKDRITNYCEKHWPDDCAKDPMLVTRLVEEALSRALIVKVNNLDVISFRTPSKIGRMLRVTKILTHDGNIPAIVVEEVTRTIGTIETASVESTDQSPKGNGVSAAHLVNRMHDELRLLNYTEELLAERVLPVAIKHGNVVCLANRRFSLTNAYRNANDIHLLPPPADDFDETFEEEEARREVKVKPVKAKRSSSSSAKSVPKSSGSESSAHGSASRRKRAQPKVEINEEEDDADMDVDEGKESANEDSKFSETKDSNVPQRVSTRKKIKKSLGPDFVDTSEQFNYILKSESGNQLKCCICAAVLPKLKPPTIIGRKAKVISDTEPSDPLVIQCIKCELKAHTSCLSLKESVGLKSQWKCGICGTCSHCKQIKRKEFIISCKTCKRAFHHGCKPIRRHFDDNWECQQCTSREENAIKRDNARPLTSLLNKSTKITTTSGQSEPSKYRTLLPKFPSTAKPVHTKLNGQSLMASKASPNSLLSKASEPPASNSLLMPVSSSGQQQTGVKSNTNSSLPTSEKQKTSAHSDFTTADDIMKHPDFRHFLLHGAGKSPPKSNSSSSTPKTVLAKKSSIGKKIQPVKVEVKCDSGESAPTATPKVELTPSSSQLDEPKKTEPVDVPVAAVPKEANRATPNFKSIFDQNSPLEVKQNFIAWINCELKHFVKFNPVPLYSLSSNISIWTAKQVHAFLSTIGFSHTADILLENQVDGFSLLLMRRQDIIDRLSLKIGPALKLYAFLSSVRDQLEAN